MASIPIKDSTGATVYIELDSAGGSSGSPARFLQALEAMTALDAAIAAKAMLGGAKNPSGNLKPLLVDASGNLLVSIAGTPTVQFASPPAVTISGTPSVDVSNAITIGAALPAGGNVIGSTTDAGSAYSESRSTSSVADASTGGPHYICAAPSSGQKIVLVDLLVSCASDLVLTFKEETSGTTLFAIDLAAKTPFQFTPRSRLKLPTADKRIYVEASASGTVRWASFVRSEA